MKLAAVVFAAGLIVMGKPAMGKPARSSAETAQSVIVCMDRPAEPTLVYRAQLEASKILARVSVPIEWSSGRACRERNIIHIRLSIQTPQSLMPGALAFCSPGSSKDIQVLYDRVRATVAPDMQAHLLAYVLAHELTHMIEGVTRHSEAGVMKAHWTAEDYVAMSTGGLAFAAEDVRLVEQGMALRLGNREAGSGKNIRAIVDP